MTWYQILTGYATGKKKLTVGVRRLSLGLTVLLVVPGQSHKTNSLQANSTPYSSQRFNTCPHPEC